MTNLELAIEYHKTVEGEYGCPGASCPGVKRLVALLEKAEAQHAPQEAERQHLLEWQANVTAAVSKAGGCHFADVASEIRTLKKHLVDAQAGQLTWECQDCDHGCQRIPCVSGGEIFKSCPHCDHMMLADYAWQDCEDCGLPLAAEMVYWQRVKGPSA